MKSALTIEKKDTMHGIALRKFSRESSEITKSLKRPNKLNEEETE